MPLSRRSASGPVLVEQVQRDLVVGGREDLAPLEPHADVLVVVDLAVADQERVGLRGAQGLRAALDVDDRQPPVAEPAPVDLDRAAVVGAAVGDALEHPLELGGVRGSVFGDDPAHVSATRARAHARRVRAVGVRTAVGQMVDDRARERRDLLRGRRSRPPVPAARGCARARRRRGRRPSRRRGTAARPTRPVWLADAKHDLVLDRARLVDDRRSGGSGGRRARAAAGAWRSTGQAARQHAISAPSSASARTASGKSLS